MVGSRAAFTTFLGGADLAEWNECLRTYADLAEGGPGQATPPPVVHLTEAICISIYVRWLASLCGEIQQGDQAKALFERLARRAPTDAGGTAPVRRLQALVAAGKGYSALAREALGPLDADLPPAIALLVMPASPGQRAALLRPYLSAPDRRPFLPAFYFYTHALMDLGYLGEVQRMLAEHRFAATNALWIDLQGSLFELRGSWREARDTYLDSSWATHRYRALICELISGGKAGDDLGASLRAQEHLRQAMLFGGSEIDQAEIARCESFVNACRWNEFDNWLVSYELGNLAFRRRRHAQAERHLKVAAAQVPESFAFTVNLLRFVNLTWLSRSSMTGGVEALPETLECAQVALASPGAERDKAPIRTFVARHTDDLRVLDPVADAGNLYQLGEAYLLRKDTPNAIRSWCSAIDEYFVPRAFDALLRQFAAFGFDLTVRHLADLVMREAWDDFFNLWELADVLLAIGRGRRVGSPGVQLEELLARLSARLQQLAEPEFQHLMRAFEFHCEYKRADIAGELLRRAERLAESPEEYLQLAAARRNLGSAEREVLGLESLLRAEKEARDRLERLQTALELARYRQASRARRILRDEGVFDGGAVLEPLEYVLALQCGAPCLSVDELHGVGESAARSLQRDLSAGLYPAHGTRFVVERLRRHVSGAEFDFRVGANRHAEGLRDQEDEPVWQSFKHSQKRLQDSRLLDDERRALLEQLGVLEGVGGAQFFRYALWGHVCAELEAAVEAVKRVRPLVAEAMTPISRSDSILHSERARRRSGLWRDYLAAGDPAQKTPCWQALQEFEREERELTRQWEALREREAAQPVRRASALADVAREVLSSIRAHEVQASPWPVQLGIGESLIRDLDAQLQRLAPANG